MSLKLELLRTFMAVMFHSWRMVLMSLIPNIIPLIFTAAIMGFVDIPIKASTILVFSIAFGISVDNTIHFLSKYLRAKKQKNLSTTESLLFSKYISLIAKI